mmetsp:Transcript_35351/g.40924  ORF Transcript_35351/g.40924 Transcript_35351/m.40924 type:complete len:239 (+) Transcript_35351:1919-2635(+)
MLLALSKSSNENKLVELKSNCLSFLAFSIPRNLKEIALSSRIRASRYGNWKISSGGDPRRLFALKSIRSTCASPASTHRIPYQSQMLLLSSSQFAFLFQFGPPHASNSFVNNFLSVIPLGCSKIGGSVCFGISSSLGGQEILPQKFAAGHCEQGSSPVVCRPPIGLYVPMGHNIDEHPNSAFVALHNSWSTLLNSLSSRKYLSISKCENGEYGTGPSSLFDVKSTNSKKVVLTPSKNN